ncbi:MAG TPA: ABC transporter substrate-binding protein [Vicinamibacteria bacterium]|nr:ABC transporter substrate-binding protein [Vicinamibacteria bacterium]
MRSRAAAPAVVVRAAVVLLLSSLASVSAVLPAAPPAPVPWPGPARVASLNLAADEVLVEILPPGRLVAVTAFADEPGTSNVAGRVSPSAMRFPRADVERLVALAPDLVVISQYTDADVQRQLERAGLRLHRMQGLETLAGFRAAVLDLGRAVGAQDAAGRLVERYDRTLADLARRLRGAARPRVLYWANPMTAGADTAIGTLIECAGAVNVGREIGVRGIAPAGAERAFVADPDVVLLGRWPGVKDALLAHPLLSQLRAVRSGKVVELPTELLVALNHHAAGACWALAHELHPARVPAERP